MEPLRLAEARKLLRRALAELASINAHEAVRKVTSAALAVEALEKRRALLAANDG